MVRFIILKLDYLSELPLEEVVWEVSIKQQLQSSMLVKEDSNLNFDRVFWKLLERVKLRLKSKFLEVILSEAILVGKIHWMASQLLWRLQRKRAENEDNKKWELRSGKNRETENLKTVSLDIEKSKDKKSPSFKLLSGIWASTDLKNVLEERILDIKPIG